MRPKAKNVWPLPADTNVKKYIWIWGRSSFDSFLINPAFYAKYKVTNLFSSLKVTLIKNHGVCQMPPPPVSFGLFVVLCLSLLLLAEIVYKRFDPSDFASLGKATTLH
jgi:hypothetical protein